MRSRGAFLLFFLILAALAATGRAADEQQLQGSVVKIQDIVKDAGAFVGKEVIVEGRIETECASGCWFILNDDSARLYVDILPSGFVIPQKSGAHARVFGEVINENGDPAMEGKIVQIDGVIYS